MRSPKGRWTMRGRAQARTIFAGFGVTGSLLAAIGTTFVVAGGIFAFDRWPGDLANPPARELAVAAAPGGSGPAAAPTESIALPAAVPVAAPAPTGTETPGGGAGDGPGPGPGGPGPVGPGPTDPTPTAPPAAPPAVTQGDPSGNGLPAVVESLAGATADTVRSVGTALVITAPVTDLVGGLVDGTGRGVGDTLRGLGSGG